MMVWRWFGCFVHHYNNIIFLCIENVLATVLAEEENFSKKTTFFSSPRKRSIRFFRPKINWSTRLWTFETTGRKWRRQRRQRRQRCGQPERGPFTDWRKDLPTPPPPPRGHPVLLKSSSSSSLLAAAAAAVACIRPPLLYSVTFSPPLPVVRTFWLFIKKNLDRPTDANPICFIPFSTNNAIA